MDQSDFNVAHQNQSVESRIVVALERISQAYRVLLWQECKDLSLSPIQVQVLIFLLHHEAPMRKVSYLADEFNMTKATISDTVKSLEQKQLIFKVFGGQDGRSYTIDLTEKGREVAQQRSFFTKEIHASVIDLSQQEKESLLVSLVGIIHHLNNAGVITLQRMCLKCVQYESLNDGKHYCKLLEKELKPTELRIDCPEFEARPS